MTAGIPRSANPAQGVSDYVAGPVMCSASTIYTSIKDSGLRPGQWAVFPGGGGGVGIQGVQLAEAMGLRPIVVDTGDERRKLALGLGAEHFIDFKEEGDPVKKVLEITGGGAHGVFVTGMDRFGNEMPWTCRQLTIWQPFSRTPLLSTIWETEEVDK